MTDLTRIKIHTADVRKTPASAEYPAPGVKSYGNEMSNLKEIINICHEAGYVIDQNLIAYISTAVTRILLRDGIVFFPKLGAFKVKHYLGNRHYNRVLFQSSAFLRIACYARYGAFNPLDFDDDSELDYEDAELMSLFNELAAERQEGIIDG